MLITKDAWEDTDASVVLRDLRDESALRVHSFVEVSDRVDIFYIYLMSDDLDDDGHNIWTNVLATNIYAVLATIQNSLQDRVQLGLLKSKQLQADFEMMTIVLVERTRLIDGRDCHVFTSTTGERVVEWGENLSVDAIVNSSVVWPVTSGT